MRRIPCRAPALVAALACFTFAAAPSRAGAANPDLSVIGQPSARWTDDPADPGRRRFRLDAGETEFVLDAALNPYARGTVVAALGEDEAGIEEAYFAMTRGLPLGLAIRAGRYRAGFGRLNAVHPHLYPFPARPRVLADYLPGEESFAETGLQVSALFALGGDAALTLSADWLQGDSFRRARVTSGAPDDPLELDGDDRAGEPRPAALGRAAVFVPLGGPSGLELGASAARGTNNVAAGARTTLAGGDAKLKWWRSSSSYLLVQAEALWLDREDASWDGPAGAYRRSNGRGSGVHVHADYNFARRYNAGASVERWSDPQAADAPSDAIGVFAGLALLEESTVFRAGWERWRPGAARGPAGFEHPAPVHTFTLRVAWSMGPHRAHQF